MIKKGTIVEISADFKSCRVAYDDLNVTTKFIPICSNISTEILSNDMIACVGILDDITEGIVLGVIL